MNTTTIDFREEYAAKLAMPEWMDFRSKVLNHYGAKCSQCPNKIQLPVHVHHRGYVSGRDPWEYGMRDVVVVCSECHERIHKEAGRIVETVDSIDPRLGEIISVSAFCYVQDGMFPVTGSWTPLRDFFHVLFGNMGVHEDFWEPVRAKVGKFDRRSWRATLKNNLLKHDAVGISMASYEISGKLHFRKPIADLLVKYFWEEALRR